MNKIVSQGALLLALFFAVFFALSQIDWMTALRVESVSRATEEKLGSMFWDELSRADSVVEDEAVIAPVDSVLARICASNGISRSRVKLHMVRSPEVNAFMLPDGHLVLSTGIIEEAKDESELGGVLAHELAHMQRKHVMKKLVKEVGLAALLSAAGANGGSTAAAADDAVRVLSSTAYDRTLEREADHDGAEYLLSAGMDAGHFASMLRRMAVRASSGAVPLSWMSTHPDCEERAASIVRQCEGRIRPPRPVLSSSSWAGLKMHIRHL